MKAMKNSFEMYETIPEGFLPKVEVAACYIEVKEKLLLLKRSSGNEAGKWGVPAGKLELNESPQQAVQRELFEETGLKPESSFCSLGSIYFRKPEMDYVYHMYKVSLEKEPAVSLSHEHTDFTWAPFNELKKMDLMIGGFEAFQACLLRSKNKQKARAYINVHLVLKRDDQVLLHLRKNTGYADGYYALVSGHAEEGESATEAIIREAFEEAGVVVSASDLKVVHIMYQKSNRLNVDIFFECKTWQGMIENREPERCAELRFFSLNQLPNNTVTFLQSAFKAISKGETYSEFGWK